MAQLKLDFWGHDLVILHNHTIRKSTGEFAFLFNEERRRIFLHALNETVKNSPFSIAATVIDKRTLNNTPNSNNPYDLALESCLEQAYCFLKEKRQLQCLTHLLVESRGSREDRDLEKTFRVISSGGIPDQYPLDIRFVNKQVNSSGLQNSRFGGSPYRKKCH